MGPGIGAGVVLDAALLVGKPVGDRLARTHATSGVFPAPIAAVIGHGDVLLHLAGNDVMHDDVACRPATGLEPELRLAAAYIVHALGKGAGTRVGGWGGRGRRAGVCPGVGAGVVL